MSKWASEEIWRSAIRMKTEQLREAERPDFILYHRGVLDPAYTEQHREKLRRSIARIEAAGEDAWREGRHA